MPRPAQASLFEESPGNDISVAQAISRHKPADKQQAAFQRLLRQVDEQRTLLGEWNAYRLRYNQRLSGELLPMYSEFRNAQCALARLLDSHLEKRVLKGKAQQTQLKELLLELLDSLLETESDSELEAIYQKHRQTSYTADKAAELEEQRAMAVEFFGLPPDELQGCANLDELLQQIQQALEGRGPGAADHEAADDAARRPPPQRKNARQQAAELKKEAASKAISQTVREVYRKLASALHPDREADADLRARKTEQMQRVNQAYEAGDLLGLLNLQFEIEQIDTDHLASLSGERLGHYNDVLREQLAELKSEVMAVTAHFRQLCPGQRKLAPQHVDREMNAEIARCQQDLAAIKADLENLRDPVALKIFLQAERGRRELEEMADFAMLDTFFDDDFPVPPPPKRRRQKKSR